MRYSDLEPGRERSFEIRPSLCGVGVMQDDVLHVPLRDYGVVLY